MSPPSEPEPVPAPLPAGPGPALAVALRYAPGSEPGAAPRVVASGGGDVAERILALAREHGVPVRQDPDLLELLARCDVGEEIPLELYAAVAELLAFLYRVNAAARGE